MEGDGVDGVHGDIQLGFQRIGIPSGRIKINLAVVVDEAAEIKIICRFLETDTIQPKGNLYLEIIGTLVIGIPVNIHIELAV